MHHAERAAAFELRRRFGVAAPTTGLEPRAADKIYSLGLCCPNPGAVCQLGAVLTT